MQSAVKPAHCSEHFLASDCTQGQSTWLCSPSQFARSLLSETMPLMKSLVLHPMLSLLPHPFPRHSSLECRMFCKTHQPSICLTSTKKHKLVLAFTKSKTRAGSAVRQPCLLPLLLSKKSKVEPAVLHTVLHSPRCLRVSCIHAVHS